MRCAGSEQDNASLTALIKELRSTHCLGDSALSVGVGLVVVVLLLLLELILVIVADQIKVKDSVNSRFSSKH